jgi:hypothetical protein
MQNFPSHLVSRFDVAVPFVLATVLVPSSAPDTTLLAAVLSSLCDVQTKNEMCRKKTGNHQHGGKLNFEHAPAVVVPSAASLLHSSHAEMPAQPCLHLLRTSQ